MTVRSMQHLNGNLLCAVDIETTGLNPDYHEIMQICILPLDAGIKPIKEVNPFYINIIPEHPERIAEGAASTNRLKAAEIVQSGFDKYKAADYLEEWIDGLKLPVSNYGIRKKIVPLGQNYVFDRAFIYKWLGTETYEYLFHHTFRDTMTSALYLNDRQSFFGEPVPFSKVKLSWLSKKLDVDYQGAHDALQDCLITAEVYRKMLTHVNFGLLG